MQNYEKYKSYFARVYRGFFYLHEIWDNKRKMWEFKEVQFDLQATDIGQRLIIYQIS